MCKSVCLLHFYDKADEPIKIKFDKMIAEILKSDRLFFNK